MKDFNDYLNLLNHSLGQMQLFDDEDMSPLKFLSDYVFDFTTYDDEVSELFARRALEVCAVITTGTTFEYIKKEETIEWYLIMCNMSFFVDKLNWGSSIRGAWWDLHGGKTFELDTCGFFKNTKQITTVLRFNEEQWNSFVLAMVEFALIPEQVQK